MPDKYTPALLIEVLAFWFVLRWLLLGRWILFVGRALVLMMVVEVLERSTSTDTLGGVLRRLRRAGMGAAPPLARPTPSGFGSQPPPADLASLAPRDACRAGSAVRAQGWTSGRCGGPG
jgi:hypothetical protein